MTAIALTAAGFFIGCSRSDYKLDSWPDAPGTDSGAYFKTQFQDESQFVVENIMFDITEMLYFAKHRALPDSIAVNAQESASGVNGLGYNVTIRVGKSPALQAKLNISGPIWSEADYAGVTSALAQSLQLPSPSKAPGDDASILEELSDGSAETLAVEDNQVSMRLESDFTNPSWHEQAAALLGAFALRENSGLFYDIRLPLCRMTAHLALARFFSGNSNPGIVGQVADCMLLTEMNNEVQAVGQIDQLDMNVPAVASWARALRAYNTLDFRPLDSSTNAPGIGQIAWFYAYSAANNRAVAWKAVGDAVVRQPDFCRIAGALGYGVEIGNFMTQNWLPLEYREINQVYSSLYGRPLATNDFIASLNAKPDRCFIPGKGKPRVRVIGWGLWAQQLQRHLCHAVSTEFHTLRDHLGLPAESWDFARKAEAQLGQLRFYGFVRRLDCTNGTTYTNSTDEGWAFAARYPHLTPIAWMDYLCGKVYFAPKYMPIANPHCNEWTSHNPLPGTAYDADPRLDYPSFTGNNGLQRVLQVHEMAPYDIGLCKYIGRSYGNNWTYENARATFGRLLPYSAIAAAAIADSLVNDPQQYERMMDIAVKWDPSFYRTLAEYQWDHGQTNEAMETYEKEEQADPDAVAVANLAVRRVEYYLATGKREKARQTADFAGEVYSALGLQAKALYLEKTGDLQGAYDWYSKIEERYNNADELLFFCCRHLESSGNDNLNNRIKARLQIWSQAREKVRLKDLSDPPKDGVSVADPGPILGPLSINSGDVIVAARGIRVHNQIQLQLARDMDPSPEMKIIYWQGFGYQEASLILNANHRLGATMQDFVRK